MSKNFYRPYKSLFFLRDITPPPHTQIEIGIHRVILQMIPSIPMTLE